MNLLQKLQQGLSRLGLSLTLSQQQQLIAYIELLEKWNRRFNLTAIRSLDEMLGLHLLDSLAISPYVVGTQVLDVGTGAGLPGIPLAIAEPSRELTLLDSNAKKIRFCRQAVMDLGLQNTTAVHQRIEKIDFKAYDHIVTRAFSDVQKMLVLLGPLLKPPTTLLAMKGQLNEAECNKIVTNGYQVEVIPLRVPMLVGQRHLLIIQQKND